MYDKDKDSFQWHSSCITLQKLLIEKYKFKNWLILVLYFKHDVLLCFVLYFLFYLYVPVPL